MVAGISSQLEKMSRCMLESSDDGCLLAKQLHGEVVNQVLTLVLLVRPCENLTVLVLFVLANKTLCKRVDTCIHERMYRFNHYPCLVKSKNCENTANFWSFSSGH